MIRFASALVLLAIPLVPVADAMAQDVTPISITLTNYAFAPGALNLKAGTTYHLHFINSGTKDHNFSAPTFFAAAQIAPEDQTKVEKVLSPWMRGNHSTSPLRPIIPEPSRSNALISCTR